MEKYICPNCAEDDMDVSVCTWARLTCNELENIETDILDAQFNDHEWDKDSSMQCRKCGFCSEARSFIKDETEDEDDNLPPSSE